MKLVKVYLKNFRGYVNYTEIDFDNITTLVGENDIGKSTILEALDIFFNDNNIKSITLYYRISTLTAFIFTLFSLLLFPTSLFFLTLKVIFVFIYLYLSYIKLFKYKIEEGLVGILASLLLLVIMFRY